MRFPIRYHWFVALVSLLLGATPSRSYVEVGERHLRVRMGWGFRAEIPRASIVDARRGDYVWWAYGVHGNGGRWIVNGSGHNIVKVMIDPFAPGRVLGVPVKLRELWVSLDDPDGFLAAIGR